MKRIHVFLLFLFAVLWFLPSASPTLATSVPIYNPKILENTEPPPDPVKVDPQVASKAPWGYALQFANLASQKILDVVGISYQDKYTIHTINDAVIGKNTEWAAVNLTPKTLQDNNVKLITYVQHMTANHVQCFYDEEGGERHEPDRKIFRPDAIGWNKLRGGTVLMAPYMTPHTLTIAGLNMYKEEPDEKVAPYNGLPCGTQTEPFWHIGLYDLGDTDQEYVEGSDQAQWTADLFCPESAKAAFQECEEQNKNLPPEEQENCTLTCRDSAHTVFSTNIPAAKEVNEKLGRGEDNKCTGFTCFFFPKAFALEFMHGQNTQDHVIELPFYHGGATSETSVYYGEGGLRQHMTALKCANAPKGSPAYDPKYCQNVPIAYNASGPSEPNTSSWANQPGGTSANPISPNFAPVSGDAQSAIVSATAGKIPQCVLEGVGQIEGAYGTSWLIDGQCKPNQCSATGPFQITVGIDTQGRTTCNDCGPSWKDGSRTCPDGWPGSWPPAAGQPSPCDYDDAANRAVELLIAKANYFGLTLGNGTPQSQRDAIIIAGDSYYGTTAPIARLGGLSYGEWVYAHCDPTYTTHQDHSFPPPGGAQSL